MSVLRPRSCRTSRRQGGWRGRDHRLGDDGGRRAGAEQPVHGGAAGAPGATAGDRAAVSKGACAGPGVDERSAAAARVPLPAGRALPERAADGRLRHGGGNAGVGARRCSCRRRADGCRSTQAAGRTGRRAGAVRARLAARDGRGRARGSSRSRSLVPTRRRTGIRGRGGESRLRVPERPLRVPIGLRRGRSLVPARNRPGKRRRNEQLRLDALAGWASSRTTPKRFAGTDAPPNRETPPGNTTSAACTSVVAACVAIDGKRPGGTAWRPIRAMRAHRRALDRLR